MHHQGQPSRHVVASYVTQMKKETKTRSRAGPGSFFKRIDHLVDEVVVPVSAELLGPYINQLVQIKQVDDLSVMNANLPLLDHFLDHEASWSYVLDPRAVGPFPGDVKS